MNRRSFFQGIAKAAAIVALAPQLAFLVKPEQFGWELTYRANVYGVYEQLKECDRMFGDPIPVPLNLMAIFGEIHKIQEERQRRNELLISFWNSP